MNNQELLPCPFCGSSADYFQSGPKTTGHGETSDYVGVKCLGCEVFISKLYYSGAKIEERKDICKHHWNQRI